MTYVNLLLRNVEFFSCIPKQACEEYWKGFSSTNKTPVQFYRTVSQTCAIPDCKMQQNAHALDLTTEKTLDFLKHSLSLIVQLTRSPYSDSSARSFAEKVK